MTKQKNPLFVEGGDEPAQVFVEQIHVFEKSKRWDSFQLDDSTLIHYSKPSAKFVFALTTDWTARGRAVEWGWLPIRERLIEIDTHTRENFFKDLDSEHEKAEESADRARKNNLENFLHDFHEPLRKVSSDINTAQIQSDRRHMKRHERRLNR